MLRLSRLQPALLFLLLIVACRSMLGCTEAEFHLAPQSRLPKWFILPEGSSRADVTVTMDTYALPWGPTATFKLWDARGRKLAQVDAKLEEVKSRLSVKGPPEEKYTEYSYYPKYQIATAKGVSEVVEYREPGPLFYLSDDPEVRTKLGINGSS